MSDHEALKAFLIALRVMDKRLDVLEAYCFRDVEPNILPDIKPVGRGLEEYTVGISGTDETI